jgi:ribonuclease Z
VQVVILGSGSPLPDPERAGPSTLVRTSAGDVLIDCGRGVLMRAAAAGTGAGSLRALLLTHLHSDHITDLNDVITTRWVLSFSPSPLAVFGPPGTAAVVQGIQSMLDLDVGYRLAHHSDLAWRPDATVTEIDAGHVLDEGVVRITAARTNHAPVHHSLAFRIDDGDASVVVAGDTLPCPGLDLLCVGADVLVHTAVRRDLIEAFDVPRLTDVLDYHSSVPDAAATACRAGVRTLLLTHLVPAPAPGTESEWLHQAAARFSGTVLLGSDLLRVDV